MNALAEHLVNYNPSLEETKARRIVDKTVNFLDIEKSETKEPSTVLCILAELVCDYLYTEDLSIIMDCGKKKAKRIFFKLEKYNLVDDDNKKKYRKFFSEEVSSIDLDEFFCYFYGNKKWTEINRYPNKKEFLESLEYLNEYDRIFFLWQTSCIEDGYPNNIIDDIKDFAIALYNREKLPDELKYMDYAEGLRETIEPDSPPYDIEAEKERLGIQ